MKIRNGFVSNSSSSSFVLLIDKDHYQEVLEDAHPFMRCMGDQLGAPAKVFGKDVMSFAGMDIQDYSWLEETHIEYDGDRGEWKDTSTWEVWDAFLTLFELDWKHKESYDKTKIFYHEQDG